MAGEIEWRGVYSKSAKRVGYDVDKAELYVEFARTGKTYVYYPDFPYTLFDKLSKSVSVGNMIRDEIQPNYQYRALD